MYFDFQCPQCINAPLSQGEPPVHQDVAFVAKYRMTEAPKLGSKIKCPCCKRRTAERVVSSGITGIIKGHDKFDVNTNYTHKAQMNGQDVNFTFVDHKLGDPMLQRNLSGLAARQGIVETNGLGNARHDPKSGRTVVDVVSNVPDPLGMIERNKKKGDYQMTKKAVNTPYKIRPKAKK